MAFNIVTATDSYKFTHHSLYPKGTERVFSYFESRAGARWPDTVFFGLQAIIKSYLVGYVVSEEKIRDAVDLCREHIAPGVFNELGWRRLLAKHEGRLPVRIRAVPEGLPVPTGNVLMTVENTDDEFPWLTNYLETLLVQAWYPSTVATQSREMKRVVLRYLEETGDPGLADFKLHDFGYRGSTSVESAGLGGAAHLVNFKGTDTVRGLEYAREFYGERMAGFSIPASEHSTITSWGRAGEVEAMANMLERYPSGLVACVSDSWDVFNAAANIWGGALRDKVLARDGCLVVRPDSGDPCDVVPRVMRILGTKFGQESNAKGYLVLNPKVRMIQGDGVTERSLGEILQAVKAAGYSADNIAFGSGGGLLQKLDRDTQRFAFKCSAVRVNGEWRGVSKDPATDRSKASKAGRMTLVRWNEGEKPADWLRGRYQTVMDGDWNHTGRAQEVMRTVFEDGRLVQEDSFASIRERAAIPQGEPVAA